MINYEDEYGVLDMSEEAMDTLELMTEKLDNDGCGSQGRTEDNIEGGDGNAQPRCNGSKQ